MRLQNNIKTTQWK